MYRPLFNFNANNVEFGGGTTREKLRMSVTRPSSTDTETDLLVLQQEFLATQQRPAARVSQVGEKRKKPRREVVELTGEEEG